MINKNKALILALCATLLGGCASTGAPLSSTSVAAYSDTIELSGRLTINFEKDGKPDTLTGKFSWSQSPAGVDVNLASPLGQTIATINVKPGVATLTQSGSAPRVAADIDSLTAQTLGWSLPVSGLRDWLQGYATAADGSRFAASPASNSVTTPDGWRLTFVSWHEPQGGAARPAPRRIDAQRSASAGAGELTIRIVVDPKA